MNLSLEPGDATILREALEQFVSDLRAEIGKTEDHDLRQELKQREAALNRVLAQLKAPV